MPVGSAKGSPIELFTSDLTGLSSGEAEALALIASPAGIGVHDLAAPTRTALDKLAAAGTKLTQFCAPYPYCAPSRAALQTGRYPFRSGMIANPTPDGGIDNLGLPASEQTIGDVLKSAGYATAYLGKWHLGQQHGTPPWKRGASACGRSS